MFKTTSDLLEFVDRKFLKDMLKNTKKGASNEKTADGIFDKIGFSTKVLREEDYGIDYLCSVGREYGDSIYPTKTFVTQLKSNFRPIEYDLSKNGKNDWLIENNLPLFFCVYEDSSGSLYFYSSSMLNDFIIRDYENVEKIKFIFRHPSDNKCRLELNKKLDSSVSEYVIDCGEPFLKIFVLKTPKYNSTEYDNYRTILEKIIIKENENIVFRNLGLPFMYWLHQYRTNDAEILFGWSDYSDETLVDTETLLNRLYQPIITLCNTYYHEGKKEDYNNMKKLVDKIAFNDKTKSILENLGFRDSKGNVINK